MIRYGIRDGGTPVGVLVVEDGEVRIEDWQLKDTTIPEEIADLGSLDTIEGGDQPDDMADGDPITQPERHVEAPDSDKAQAAITHLQHSGFNVVGSDAEE